MNTFPWTENHPLLESTEAILRAGAQVDPSQPICERQWHEDAIELSGLVSPADLSAAAFTLLENLPCDDTVRAIRELKQKRNPDEAMQRIKMARKLFFIVRDIVILTSEGSPAEEFDSLISTCRTLGEIADTKGRRGKKRSIRAVQDLQDDPPSPQPLKSRPGLVTEVTNRLQNASLLGNPDMTQFDALHTARKNFRRVAALGLMSVAGLGFLNCHEFAINGVALSHRHGEIKDAAHLQS